MTTSRDKTGHRVWTSRIYERSSQPVKRQRPRPVAYGTFVLVRQWRLKDMQRRLRNPITLYIILTCILPQDFCVRFWYCICTTETPSIPVVITSVRSSSRLHPRSSNSAGNRLDNLWASPSSTTTQVVRTPGRIPPNLPRTCLTTCFSNRLRCGALLFTRSAVC